MAYHWEGMDTAPQDRPIVVWAAPAHGLPAMASLCQWHEDAGFCIDELREPMCWTEAPDPDNLPLTQAQLATMQRRQP